MLPLKVFQSTQFFYTFNKVLVIIDAKPKDLGLPTEAYIAVEEVHDVSMHKRIRNSNKKLTGNANMSTKPKISRFICGFRSSLVQCIE